MDMLQSMKIWTDVFDVSLGGPAVKITQRAMRVQLDLSVLLAVRGRASNAPAVPSPRSQTWKPVLNAKRA